MGWRKILVVPLEQVLASPSHKKVLWGFTMGVTFSLMAFSLLYTSTATSATNAAADAFSRFFFFPHRSSSHHYYGSLKTNSSSSSFVVVKQEVTVKNQFSSNFSSPVDENVTLVNIHYSSPSNSSSFVEENNFSNFTSNSSSIFIKEDEGKGIIETNSSSVLQNSSAVVTNGEDEDGNGNVTRNSNNVLQNSIPIAVTSDGNGSVETNSSNAAQESLPAVTTNGEVGDSDTNSNNIQQDSTGVANGGRGKGRHECDEIQSSSLSFNSSTANNNGGDGNRTEGGKEKKRKKRGKRRRSSSRVSCSSGIGSNASILVNSEQKDSNWEKKVEEDNGFEAEGTSVGDNGDAEGMEENSASLAGEESNVAATFQKCDIFDGRWVRDESMPYYPGGSCPFLDDDFNCHKNARPDTDFLKWRWLPYQCDIPRLNATDFLERLRGQRLVFVGDSLNRNMWESLICILRHGVRNKKKVHEVSGRRKFKTSGYYSFIFEEYKCFVDFVRSPFLVKEIFKKSANGSPEEKLRLDILDETTVTYRTADIIVFNTGHWWTHEKTSAGVDYYQEGKHVYPLLEVTEAYRKALNTWARWIDKNINSRRTQVFFRGYSLTHFRGGQWNSGGQCHRETEPIFNDSYLSSYPWKMKTLEETLQTMKTPVVYLNISKLTDYRKDGHPSIYRERYNSVEEQIAAEKIQDCSHWCLPGVPDAWNELLYASLLMIGRGSWKS